ncbi:MAG: HDOD domain-containing protein [Deltaproteobacteria bacterium]|nr:HDOD domain-containing protein [Deltaproteobacteria bacterium]
MRDDVVAGLERAKDIPTLPEIVVRLMEALNSGHAGAAQIAEIVSTDPAIAARILRLANSAYYGRAGSGREITSVPYAVARIGFREIKNLVMTLSVFRMFELKGAAFDLKGVWRHSASVAYATKVVHGYARDGYAATDEEIDAYYAAGLLHEIGLLLLYRYFPDRVNALFEGYQKNGGNFLAGETEHLGTTHATVGGFIARRWDLPEMIVVPMENYLDPETTPESFRRAARVVHLADYLVSLHHPDQSAVPLMEATESYQAALRALDIPLRSVDEILDLVEEGTEHSKAVVSF